ncbi:hypothetical protein V5799_007398 [Amblyomma americanum]|uniref:beta-mannosidase n=1 Tax=Amblyomma americanum TaxID=6943 RepID=A0AAQ4FI17_AMBAM
MRAKLIGDAYYRDNDERFAWVGHDNWTYTRDFQLKEEHTHHRRILLVAHGIDTVATVYVNDVPVGETDNMFVRYVFDIKQYIKVGYNNVSVEFTSAVAVAYARERSHAFARGHQVPPECPPVRQRGECGVNHVRKVQASFSWEMAPAFPTQGICNWPMFPFTSPSVPFVFLAVCVCRPRFIRVRTLNALNVQSLGIEAWWPNGHGVQRLYPLSVSLSMGSDTATMIKSIGFRTVDLVQEPLVNSTGATFFLRVNGLPMFAKGSTWMPADAFPDRVTGERLEALLDAAAAAHMNLLRVWGGGLYESDLFYELADRRGLMVWQDFAFASALYPATPEFLDSVAREARQQIYQAMGVKTQAEHYRRQRLVVHRSQGLTMGAIYWHLNDVWQAPSWSSIDYNGNWKMLHYFAKRFFEPLLVSPYDEDGRLIVYVLDDLYRGQPYELLLQVKLYHYASLEPKASISHNITVASYAQPVYVANISKLLASASCNLNNSFLTFNLLNGTDNQTLSTNFLLLQVPRFAKDIASVTLQVTDVTADTPVGPETGQAKTPDDKAKKNVSSTTDEASLNRTSHGPKIEYSNGSTESGQTPVSESLTNLGHTSLQEHSEGTSPDAMADKANVHVIGLTTDGVALFVWLSAGKVKGHFSDNGFIMTEHKGTVTFTSDLSVTTEQLRANLTVTCLNCLFKYHYLPMAEAKA